MPSWPLSSSNALACPATLNDLKWLGLLMQSWVGCRLHRSIYTPSPGRSCWATCPASESEHDLAQHRSNDSWPIRPIGANLSDLVVVIRTNIRSATVSNFPFDFLSSMTRGRSLCDPACDEAHTRFLRNALGFRSLGLTSLAGNWQRDPVERKGSASSCSDWGKASPRCRGCIKPSPLTCIWQP